MKTWPWLDLQHIVCKQQMNQVNEAELQSEKQECIGHLKRVFWFYDF